MIKVILRWHNNNNILQCFANSFLRDRECKMAEDSRSCQHIEAAVNYTRSHIKRQKPLNKTRRRPKMTRSDTRMVDDFSGEEDFQHDFSSDDKYDSLEEDIINSNANVCRRKTLPVNPGQVTPPVPRRKKKKSHSVAADFYKKDAVEKIQEGTKLVVIEYLSNVPVDALRARNRTNKFHTTGSQQCREIRRVDSDLRRSASDVGSYGDDVKKKLQSLALPLKRIKSISPTLLKDIEHFDKSELRKGKKKSTLYLPIERITDEERQLSVPSPETRAVQKLEWISSRILEDFPQLLDEPLNKILTPLDSGNELTYETFAEIAKQSFNRQISKLSGRGGMLSRVALTFYLVREVIVMEHVNDSQLELLVEYASRFVAENMYNWITKTNSLGSLKLEEDLLNATGSFFDSVDLDELDEFDGPSNTKKNDSGKGTKTSQITGLVNEWMTYGVAFLAVGLGIAYNYFKQ